MPITLTPYSNLLAFRLGENIIFSNFSSIKCNFTQIDDSVEIEVSLCAVFNDEILPICQDLAVIDFPHSRIDFDNKSFYSDVYYDNIPCDNLFTELYDPECAIFVIDISALISNGNNIAPSLQSDVTAKEMKFIKRVIGKKHTNTKYQVIDLKPLLLGLEKYIKDKFIIPIVN